MTVKDAIRQLALAGLELHGKVCTVDAVDEQARTVDCTPIDEGAPLLGVNLQANQDSEDGVVLFPAVDSFVVVSFLGESVAVVTLCEKIDKIALKIGETTAAFVNGQVDVAVEQITAKITKDAVTFNGGSFGGLVKIEELRRSLDSLKNYCETLSTAVSAGLNGVGTGPTASGSAGAGAFDGAMASAVIAIENMENEKVKH